jgi:hypothetical protein
MRSSKLIPALAAASALLVLAPAGAVARPAGHKHIKAANPNGRCRVGLLAEPRSITAGETVQLFGQLLCTAGSTENQTVTVFERTAGSSVFKVVGESKTVAGGLYSFAVPAVSTDAWFYVRTASRRSPTKAVRVAPVVKLKGPAEKSELHTGKKNAVTFEGTVSPSDVGAEVLLEREQATSEEEWIPIQRTFVTGASTFTFVHTFALPGDANIRAVVRAHGTSFTTRGISNTLSYVIAGPQNPNLTLETKTNPISYGAPVTLEGKLNGGTGKTITLLSRKKGSKTFSPVTTTTGGTEGKYSFVQVPLTNTYYRVTGGGQTSRQLFVGVKYILTAGVSAKTVQSGQALTFSGTVTPPHKGKTVYLERENAFGGGYHVIDVGAVTPEGQAEAGTYVIKHFMFGPAKTNFRIKVPGDPENQAVSSTPFAVEITLAPPLALHAAPQGKQPR